MQKLHPNPIVHYGMLILIFGVGAATLISYTVLHAMNSHHSGTATAMCPAVGKKHVVTLNDRQFDKKVIAANRCDQLIVINKDDKVYRLALGSHDNHMKYPGFEEKALKPAAQLSINLTQEGEYKIHDHLHEASEAELIIR